MNNLQHYINEVGDIIKDADELAGTWNGDEAGRLEELATSANEISQKAIELKKLLEEHKELEE